MSNFPIVYDDESIFSVTQRLVSLNCGPSNKQSAQRLFSSSSLQFCSAFPSSVPILEAMSNIDAKAWIKHHTILPQFEAFTPKTKYQLAYQQLLSGKGEAVFKSLSIIANRQCVSNTFRFCAYCAQEDKLNVGLSYWHTVHQLPGYYVCHKHQTPLLSQHVTRKRFDNWPQYKFTRNKRAQEQLVALADFARFFHIHYAHCEFNHSLKSIYFSAMRDKGYVTDGEQIRVKMMHRELKHHWLPLMQHPEVASIFDLARRPLFPSCLFFKEQHAIAPLKHLLLMAYLFKDINELRLYDDGMNRTRPLIARPFVPQKVSDESTILDLLKQDLSLRTVAEIASRSVSYVKQVACNNNVSISTRAQRLFQTEKAQIITALKKGETTQTISKKFACSQGAIEQILSQNKKLVKYRSTLRESSKRRQKRCSMLSTITSLSNGTRNDIKKHNNAAYMWLFKHDKVWLYAHLPSAIPRRNRSRKIKVKPLDIVNEET